MKPTHRMPILLFGAFIIVLGITAFVTFSATREMVGTWELPALERTPFNPQPITPTVTEPEEAPRPVFDPTRPLQPLNGPQGQGWDGNRPVTVLLLGLDARGESTQVPPHSDTLLLFTFDPETNTARLLSIPRDLWVPIPGYESGKINTAYQLGETYQVAGGGPALVMNTLELLLGVPIDDYAQVDFRLFARFIDELGGVKIDVPEMVEISIIDDKIKKVSPGLQTLSGEVALASVRARTTPGGDFDRVQRQQLVLMGIRNRILDFDLLPSLIAKAPLLYSEFSDRIRTNMTPNDIFKLAVALQGVPTENISMAAIGLDDVTFSKSPQGTDVLVPIPERIRLLRDEIFVLENPLSSAQASKSISQLVEEEAAKIKVINGTTTPALAALTTEFLLSEDFYITATDIADKIYRQTILIDYTGNPHTVGLLALLMNIHPTNIIQNYNPRSPIDIEIFLGEDWALSGVTP